MTRGFNKMDPIRTTKIHQHPRVVEIFTRHQLLGLLYLLTGYDDDVAREFEILLVPLARAKATIVVRGFSVIITLESISRITALPLGL